MAEFVPVYTPQRDVQRTQNRVLETIGKTVRPEARVRTASFSAAAGGSYRVTSTTTATLDVVLPPATADTRDQAIRVYVDDPIGGVRFTCPGGDVDGFADITLFVTALVLLYSNGAGRWSRA